MSEPKVPSGIDRFVGQRLRWRRRELRLSQEKLGEKLDLTFQQVQKYEKGINRISAGRLYEIAKLLGVPIDFFYEGAGDYLNVAVQMTSESEGPSTIPMLSADTLELAIAYQSIEDPDLRRSLLENIQAIAHAFEQSSDKDD